MRHIQKGLEPTSWKECKSTPGAVYKPTTDLRMALLKEQGHLCGYCMKRINHHEDSITSTKIEHIQCQAKFPDRDMDYSNMILCCDGGESNNIDFHCDKSKHNHDISFSPLNANVTTFFSYTGDGSMKAYDKAVQAEIGSNTDNKQKGILNLNNFNLKRSRKQVWDALHGYLGKKGWTNAVYKQTRQEWLEIDKDGMYKEFSQVVLYYLDKKLNRT